MAASAMRHPPIGSFSPRPAFLPSLEPLELRLAPMLGASSVPASIVPTGPFALFNGTVKLSSNTSDRSGALLYTGTDILTVAHGLGSGSTAQTVLFEMARDGHQIPIEFTVPPNVAGQAQYQILNPKYIADNNPPNDDIAVLRLTDQDTPTPSATRLLVAPYGAQRYELYTAQDELGRDFIMAGYGATGIGLTGSAQPGGQKRAAQNTFDGTGSFIGNEVQEIKVMGQPTGGQYVLFFDGVPSGYIPASATAGQVQNALQAIPALAGNVTVRAGFGVSTSWSYFVEFHGTLANTNVSQFVADSSGLMGGANPQVSIITKESGGGITVPEDLLIYDFDESADPTTDALGMLYGRMNSGLGDIESNSAPGDSGSPLFLEGKIAGLASVNLTAGLYPDIDLTQNNSFGEIALATRVSHYVQSFISPTLYGDDGLNKYGLVLEMDKQVLGNDGTRENITITARLNGANLELVVDDPTCAAYSGVYYSEPVAFLSSLTIRGSADDIMTYRLDSTLGLGQIHIQAVGVPADNTVVLGDPATGNLDGFTGTLKIFGCSITANDVGAGAGHNYNFVPESLSRDGAQVFNYQLASWITLNSTSHSDDVLLNTWSTPLRLDLGAGDDVVNIGSIGFRQLPEPVTVDAGQGTDLVTINDQMAAAGSNYSVTSTGVSRPDGFYVTYGPFGPLETLVLNTGFDGGDVAGVWSTDFLTATTINSGGNDQINVGGVNDTLDPISGSLTVNSGCRSGGDRLRVTDSGALVTSRDYIVTDSTIDWHTSSIAYNGLSEIKMYGGSLGDSYAIQGTAFPTVTYVNGGGGYDVFDVWGAYDTIDHLSALLQISGGLQFGELNVRDSGAQNNETYSISDDAIRRTGNENNAEIDYSLVSFLKLYAGRAENEMDIVSTSSFTNTTVYGGPARDRFRVTPNAGNLDAVAGHPLTLVGGGGGDILSVDDSAADSGLTYTLSAANIVRGSDVTINYDGFSQLEIECGDAGNVINVVGTSGGCDASISAGAGRDDVYVAGTATGSTATVVTGDGSDDVTVGDSAAKLDGILDAVMIIGGGGGTLTVNDVGTTDGKSFDVTAGSISRLDVAPIGYAFVPSVTLNAGRGGNDIQVYSSAVGTTTWINSGDGIDNMTVAGAGASLNKLDDIKGPVVLNGTGRLDQPHHNRRQPERGTAAVHHRQGLRAPRRQFRDQHAELHAPCDHPGDAAGPECGGPGGCGTGAGE